MKYQIPNDNMHIFMLMTIKHIMYTSYIDVEYTP